MKFRDDPDMARVIEAYGRLNGLVVGTLTACETRPIPRPLVTSLIQALERAYIEIDVAGDKAGVR